MKRVLCYFALISSTILVFGNTDGSSNEYDDIDDDDDDINPYNSTINSSLIFITQLENKTKDEGAKFVEFICEVQNLHNDSENIRIKFTWRHNYGIIQMEKNSKRISIKELKLKNDKYRSTLKIKNVDYLDHGFYDCTVSNGVGKIRSEAFFSVTQHNGGGGGGGRSLSTISFDQQNHDIITFPTNIHSATGASAIFDLPTNNDITKMNEFQEAAMKNGKTFDLTATGKMLHTNNNVGGEALCQLYRGETCKNLLESRYVFVQPPYKQREIEQKLSDAFLVISQSNDISSSCNKFAKPSLCYSAFPLCVNVEQINRQQSQLKFTQKNDFMQSIRNKFGNSLRRICKKDCVLLETELCSKEYAIAKRHSIIGQTLELEECQFLPNETDINNANCLQLGVDRENVNKDDRCFWDDGELYRGMENMTETGNKCMRWSHQFHIPLSEHPELTGHNFCRNPGGIEPQPFCYIDPLKKELCNITKCTYVVWMYVVASFVIITLIFSIVIGILCCRKRNKLARNLQNMNVPTADKNIYGNPGPNSPMELNNLLPPNIPPQRGTNQHHSNKNGYQNVPQYTYKELQFIEELGEGAFGKVYKGELKTKQNGKIFVAVKSLKENASAKTQADFQREIELISELKHPNIICLMGVVVKQEPMCMLFEFMSEGDLHEFLIANSPSEGKSLTQNQFLHIAIQIAQGMEYLSENHYVHRDLAARNCLVSKDLIVKISDFGLSRDMYSCDYYRVQSKSLLPVRWMPPESILYGKFTTESDVWSYGVVLWEIYSYGLQPYYGYNNQEVINMIRSRKLLPCPDACPSYCYALMVECWAELSIRRPSFGEISHRLRVWKQNGNSNGAYFKTPIHSSSNKSGDSSICEIPAATWERNLKTTKLNESQSSLTSRSSSLGNKTQSTSLSNNEQHARHHRKNHQHRSRTSNEDSLDRVNPKNTVVSSNGDNFEIKITH